MSKTHMFDNYDSDCNCQPNNMFEDHWCEQPGLHNIIRGTTPEHFFITPFKYNEIQELTISYKQGYKKVLINKTLDDIKYFDGNVFYYEFTIDETSLFEAIPNEPCLVQLKAKLNNGDVIVSDIYKLDVLNILNDEVNE